MLLRTSWKVPLSTFNPAEPTSGLHHFMLNGRGPHLYENLSQLHQPPEKGVGQPPGSNAGAIVVAKPGAGHTWQQPPGHAHWGMKRGHTVVVAASEA